MHIPLASIGLRQIDIDAVIQTLNSGNLTMGPKVREFEFEMASYLKSKHFVMVNSGSSANLLMIEALLRPTKGKPKLSLGDSVLLPAIAWPTTVWPVVQLGLNPIFVDVNLNTLAMDFDLAQDLIDESRIEIKAMFPIHPLGRAIPNSRMEEFSKKNDLLILNDVCESLGSWDKQRHAGNFGIASSFSFYFSHHLTTMEGGGIATDDDDFADDLRSMRSHGWSRDRSDSSQWNRNLSLNDSKFLFVSTGYNVRPMEIQAAIGLLQLKNLESFIEKRRIIARQVSDALKNTKMRVIGGETLYEEGTEKSNSWMLIPISVFGENAARRKNTITEFLNGRGVETRPVLTGNFLAQPAIQRIMKQPADAMKYTNATKIAKEAFLVGAHHELSQEQIRYLCDTLVEADGLI